MHECNICGFDCDCDGEDLYQAAPLNCSCDHDGSGLDPDGNEIEDYAHQMGKDDDDAGV